MAGTAADIGTAAVMAGGHAWRGGYRGIAATAIAVIAATAIAAGRGYRGWGWGGWWGPGVAISIGGYGRRCWSPTYGYYPCRYRWGY